MSHGYELRTKVYENGQIHQDLYSVTHGRTQRVQSSLVDSKEGQIQQALMLLGWMPPAGNDEDVPIVAGDKVMLMTPGEPPVLSEVVSHGRVCLRLSNEVMVTSTNSAGHAFNHIVEAVHEDLEGQGMALRDFAVPALRWSLLKVAMLEGDMRRLALDRARRPHYTDTEQAKL